MIRAATLMLLFACSNRYQFDDAQIAHKSTTEPREKSDSVFLSLLYVDLLGRRPETYTFHATAQGKTIFEFPIDELAVKLEGLNSFSDTSAMRAILVDGLLQSDEAQANILKRSDVDDPAAFVTGVFQQFLGRDPSPWELYGFLKEWFADDAVTPQVVMRAVILSQEYRHR